MIKDKKESKAIGKRLAVSTTVLELLETEVSRIKSKGPHYKLNESKLASIIIELFCKKYLIKEQELVESNFFDKKIYLKRLIENSDSNEELARSLDNFLSKSKIKKMIVVQDES